MKKQGLISQAMDGIAKCRAIHIYLNVMESSICFIMEMNSEGMDLVLRHLCSNSIINTEVL